MENKAKAAGELFKQASKYPLNELKTVYCVGRKFRMKMPQLVRRSFGRLGSKEQ